MVSSLAVAHHNAGIELEYLGKYEESMQLYLQGISLSRDELGPHHEITKTLQENLRKAKELLTRKLELRTGFSAHRSQQKYSPHKSASGKTSVLQSNRKLPGIGNNFSIIECASTPYTDLKTLKIGMCNLDKLFD